MEAAGQEGERGHGHRIDVSLLPLKKRASNDTSTGRVSSPDDSNFSSPPKKRRVVDAVVVGAAESEDNAAEDPEAPVAAAAVAPPVAAAAADDTKDHHQSVAAPPRPCPRDDDDDDVRVYVDDDLGEALRRRLAELGATRPWFVHRKTLQMSDVCPNQNRLLVSRKRETVRRVCPITGCFSAAERERVGNKGAGLLVTALDRDGVPHQLTCKFLDSNGGYRFISGWKAFLSRNGVGLDSTGAWRRDVDVELRAFRSRALPRQPRLDAEGKPVKKKTDEEKVDEYGRKVEEYEQVPDHFHKDGALGLILLHHEQRRRRAKREEDDDGNDDDDDEGMAPPAPVARDKGKKKKKKRGNRDEAAPAAVAASSSSSPAAGAEPGESMSKAEMVAKYGDPTTKAMIGLIMLRDAVSKERQDNVGEGDDMSKDRGQ